MKDSTVFVMLAFRHYGYYHAPQAMWGDLFSIAGALCLIALIVGSGLPLPIKAWAIGEEALVAGCTAAWMAAPWEYTEERCSARVGFKLGAIGLVGLAWSAWSVAVKVDRSQNQERHGK